MEIIDLTEDYEETYCKCLEDWSDEMKDAGDYKKRWLAKKKSGGLRVKLARNAKGEIVGMIHYVPIESAPVKGEALYYIYCIWVHGYKAGVGNYQGKGIGPALLEAAENDARERGAKGMAAWGILLPFFMRSGWFKRRGYKKADRDGFLELVWKPFTDDALRPQLIKMKKKPVPKKETVTVTCFRNGWCPAQNLSCERMKRAVEESDGGVEYIEIDTENRKNLEEWGIADAIFIDDRMVNTGPPPTYEKLKKMLSKKIKRVRHRGFFM